MGATRMQSLAHSLQRMLFATATGFCLSAAGAELPLTETDEVIVTATRGKSPAKNVPYSVSDVDARRILEMQPQSFPEALKEVPGVFIQQTGHGQGSPFIRGFTGFRTLGSSTASA